MTCSRLGSFIVCCVLFGVIAGNATPANACDPPFSAWFVDDVVFADSEAAPINGVVAVRLQFIDDASTSRWPDEAVVRDTVSLELTRDGDEVVEGIMVVDRDVNEVRFISERLLAEGITYTLRIGLINEDFENGDPNAEEIFSFTTGDGLDEAAPAFSGLQTVNMSENPRPIRECCLAPEDSCTCFPECSWCWVVDWEYQPLVKLTWRAVEDEFGLDTINYLLYRVDGPDGEPEEDAEPILRRATESGEQSISLVMDREDPGPYCFAMHVQDIYGRTIDPGTVLCGERSDIVPVEREEVPQPDRSGCVEQGEDVGGDADVGSDDTGSNTDVGVDTTAGEDVGVPDAGATDSASGADGSASVSTPKGDEGCGCVQAPARSPSRWPLAVVGALLCAVVLRRAR